MYKKFLDPASHGENINHTLSNYLKGLLGNQKLLGKWPNRLENGAIFY